MIEQHWPQHVVLTQARVLIGTATTVNELVRTREVYPRGPSNQHRHSRHPDDPLPVCCCRLLHGLDGAGPQRARNDDSTQRFALESKGRASPSWPVD